MLPVIRIEPRGGDNPPSRPPLDAVSAFSVGVAKNMGPASAYNARSASGLTRSMAEKARFADAAPAADRLAVYRQAVAAMATRPPSSVWELSDDNDYMTYQLIKMRAKDLFWLLRLCTTADGDDLAGHCHRVARLSSTIAHRLTVGHTQRQRQAGRWLWCCGLIHDIGKLACLLSTAHNRGGLDDDDRAAVRLHPVVAGDLLRLRGFPAPVVAAVAGHHERIGGGGYPDGDRDPTPWARWLAVADVFDALSVARGYKSGLPRLDVLRTMRDDPGLDHSAVEAVAAITANRPGGG